MKAVMLSTRNMILSLGIFFLLSSISGADPIKSPSEGLVSWESKPRLVDQGSGLQLLLGASEGMSFVYAARKGEGGQDLYYGHSHTMGDTFSKSYPVNEVKGEVSFHGENGPIFKQGSGIGKFAVWQGGKNLKFARSMNFGRSFLPAIKINDEDDNFYHSFQSMDVAPDGTIYVAWLDGRGRETNVPGSSSLYLARSLDQGATFGENIKIAGNACPCCRPALAFNDSGRVFISWRHVYKDNNRVVAVSTSDDKGETWSGKTLVTKTGWKVNGCPHSGASMKYDNGKLFIAWYSAAGSQAALRAGISNDEGKSFNYLGEVQGKVLDANHPNIQMINGEAWTIFQGRDPDSDDGWGITRPWLMKIAEDGSFSQPSMLPFLGDSVAYPYLFAGNGERIYAAWTELSENGPKAVLCRGRIRQ
jgi:hypothetical protein